MAEPSVKAAPQLAQVRVARMVWMEMAARVAATLVEADLAWEVDMAMGMRTVAGVVEASLAREAVGMVEQEVAVVVRVVKDLVV